MKPNKYAGLIGLLGVCAMLLSASPVAAADLAVGHITQIIQCHRGNDGHLATLVKIDSGSETKVVEVALTRKDGSPDPRSVNLSVAMAAYLSGKRVWVVYHRSSDPGEGTCRLGRDGYIHSQDNNYFMIFDEGSGS